MKYLVKNVTTGEETLCEKVVVDGFDYYVSDSEPILESDIFMFPDNFLERASRGFDGRGLRKVIATTNPSLDLPMVIDEVEELAEIDTDKCPCYKYPNLDNGYYDHVEGFRSGYNKAKETYSFTKDDMVEFTEWLITKSFREGTSDYTTEELLGIWQEQRTITISVK
jgi:hypothetical protein